MFENIIVLAIVFVAIFFTSRRIYRILSSKKAECGCGAEEDCSVCSVPSDINESCCDDSQDFTPRLKV